MTSLATAALQAPEKRSGNPPGGGISDAERYRQLQEAEGIEEDEKPYVSRHGIVGECFWGTTLPCALFVGIVALAAWRLLT